MTLRSRIAMYLSVGQQAPAAPLRAPVHGPSGLASSGWSTASTKSVSGARPPPSLHPPANLSPVVRPQDPGSTEEEEVVEEEERRACTEELYTSNTSPKFAAVGGAHGGDLRLATAGACIQNRCCQALPTAKVPSREEGA